MSSLLLQSDPGLKALAERDVAPTEMINFGGSHFDIGNPPIRFTYPDMSDDNSSKGGIIEWGGMMDGQVHPYGIATRAYQQNQSATFTAPTGYKKWAWVTAHYDSPAVTGEEVHQHLNLETVKADWVTAITRLQISFGEDQALVSFPNSHVKFYPDFDVQIGNDAAGAVIKHDTANSKISIAGNTPWNFTGTGGMRIGSSGAPAGRLHVERSDDANVLVLRNTLGSANGAAIILVENGTAGAIAFQSGLSGEGTKRFSFNTSGKMEWGPGSGARDTNLYRFAADSLGTDDSFTATGGLITKYGTAPADAPADGAIRVGSDSKIYVRVAGAWKSVAVA